MGTSTNQHARQELDRNDKNQGVGVFWSMVALLLGCVVMIFFFAVTRSIERAKDFAILMELEQIDLALERYKKEHGAYPPNADSSDTAIHLQTRLNGQEINDLSKLKSLDEDEVLLFWLGDVASRSLTNSKHDSPFYIVDDQRTTDVDEDGFPEYTGEDDHVFILRNGRAMYKDRDSDNVFSAKELRSNQLQDGG